MEQETVKLTKLSKCAGCGAKVGAGVLAQLLQMQQEESGPQVLIGAGVDAAAIRHFRSRYPQACAFHMSGKTELESGMIFRRAGVPMGLPGLDEWHIQQTDVENVRAAKAFLDASL